MSSRLRAYLRVHSLAYLHAYVPTNYTNYLLTYCCQRHLAVEQLEDSWAGAGHLAIVSSKSLVSD